ncbi:hypothetical protein MCOR18_000705 [Pyricularia oryzae]|nr:hypothetical protein MCOR18_000705 [Pyricularia oryzae]
MCPSCPSTLSSNQTLAQTTRTECKGLGGTLTCASAPKKGGGEVLQRRCRIAYFGGNPIEGKWVPGDEGKCQGSDTEAEEKERSRNRGRRRRRKRIKRQK